MLKGKTALITGASRGIGRAIAHRFSEYDCFVGINYVKNQKEAQNVLDQLPGPQSFGMLLKGDISNTADVKQMVKDLVQKRNHIDILVLNAGIYIRHGFLEIGHKDWKQVMDVNLNSCYYVCQEVLPYMPDGGRIMFISSQLAFKGTAHGADYATSKAGMLGLMRSLSLELAEKNILVNAIAPGTIDTDIISGYTEKQRQDRINQIPLKRLGSPVDIANVCVFLASDLSGYMTGETLHVNGGLYIH